MFRKLVCVAVVALGLCITSCVGGGVRVRPKGIDKSTEFDDFVQPVNQKGWWNVNLAWVGGAAGGGVSLALLSIVLLSNANSKRRQKEHKALVDAGKQFVLGSYDLISKFDQRSWGKSNAEDSKSIS